MVSPKEPLLSIEQAQDGKQGHWVPLPNLVLWKLFPRKYLFLPTSASKVEDVPSTSQMKNGQSNPGEWCQVGARHLCYVPVPGSPSQRSIQRRNTELVGRSYSQHSVAAAPQPRLMQCILRCPLKSCCNRKNYICAMRMS